VNLLCDIPEGVDSCKRNAASKLYHKVGLCNTFYSHVFLCPLQLFCYLSGSPIHTSSKNALLRFFFWIICTFIVSYSRSFSDLFLLLLLTCYLLVLLFLLLTEAVKFLGPCRNCSCYYRMVLLPGLGDFSIHSFFLVSLECTHILSNEEYQEIEDSHLGILGVNLRLATCGLTA